MTSGKWVSGNVYLFLNFPDSCCMIIQLDFMGLMGFYSGIVMGSPTDCVFFVFSPTIIKFDHYVYIMFIYCLIFAEPSTRFEKKEHIASFSGRYCSIFLGASIVIL